MPPRTPSLFRRDSAVDESVIHGDHYFLEALTKVLLPERRPLLDAAGDRIGRG